MNRKEALKLLKFLEDNCYLAGSLTAELLLEIVMREEGEEQSWTCPGCKFTFPSKETFHYCTGLATIQEKR